MRKNACATDTLLRLSRFLLRLGDLLDGLFGAPAHHRVGVVEQVVKGGQRREGGGLQSLETRRGSAANTAVAIIQRLDQRGDDLGGAIRLLATLLTA